MSAKDKVSLLYAFLIAIMLSINAYPAAICLAIIFHAFYTKD
jgi:hypothetical protein